MDKKSNNPIVDGILLLGSAVDRNESQIVALAEIVERDEKQLIRLTNTVNRQNTIINLLMYAGAIGVGLFIGKKITDHIEKKEKEREEEEYDDVIIDICGEEVK